MRLDEETLGSRIRHAVSVIIPTYAHSTYIGQTLESVFSQSFEDYEVIVVNDGSPDDASSRLADLSNSHRIRYVEQPHAGPAAARNHGLSLANGEFIAFLDDDDLWPRDKLEWQVRYLRRNPTVSAVAGDRYWWDGHSPTPRVPQKTREVCVLTWESLFRGNPIASPGQVLLRRSVLDRVGFLNPDIWGADDFDLWFRIASVTRFELHDRIALFYRAHNSNASHQLDRMLANTRAVIQAQIHKATPMRAPLLTSTANRWMYDYVGTRLVERLKEEIARSDIHAALASIRTLATFASQGPDGEIFLKMSHDLLPTRKALLDRLPSPLVRCVRTVKHTIRPSSRYRRPDREPPAQRAKPPSARQLTAPIQPAPLVSVVIPVHNAEAYVRDAIMSVLSQDFRDFDCVIVDDGSTDRSPAILSALAAHDRRIRVITIPQSGIVAALNLGVDQSRGALIARMDADDICLPRRFSRQVRHMAEFPQCIAVGAAVTLVDPLDTTLWNIDVQPDHDGIERELFAGNGWALFHPTCMMRRQAFLASGGYRPRFEWVEDLDLFLRMAQSGKLSNLTDPMLRYRQHLASVNRTRLDTQIERTREAVLDAYHRRGIELPNPFQLRARMQLDPYDQTRAWCQRAIFTGNRRAARHHALTALRMKPLRQEAWKLMLRTSLPLQRSDKAVSV
jgi:glycosyltransferase involved in cell wall biosynthesis